MKTINGSLQRLTVAKPATHRNMALFPLIDADPAAASYLTLDQALEAKLLRISEVGLGGSVPELEVRNDADRPVLLLDGEELVGAKQNRVLNITVLVAAGTTMVIPVSCVEQGRWGFRGNRDFDSGKRTLFARGRAAKMADVSHSIRTVNRRAANQSGVWDSISDCDAAFDVESPTGSMNDVYTSQHDNLESFETAFEPLTGQTGAVFAIDGKITGCELFDSDTTWARQASKLIGSYALDALQTHKADAAPPKTAAAEAFLRKVANAAATSHDAIGLGRDIRMDSDQLVGGALLLDGRIVHLSAFALAEESGHDTRRSRAEVVSLHRRRHNRAQ